MSNYAISLKRTSLLLVAMTFTALLMVVNLAAFFGRASAEQLQNRSLTLSSTLPGDEGATTPGGTETNGADVTYTFQFDAPSVGSANLGSMSFVFCTNAIGTCDALDVDEDLDLTSATFNSGASSGLPATFTLDTPAGTNDLRLTATPAALTAGTTVTVVFDDIVNPDVVGTFFVRVTTYSDAAYASAVDDGTVASAITEGIYITSRVAETLGFSTKGLTPTSVVETENGTTCDPLVGSGAIQLGDPSNEYTLSISAAFDAWSAFRLYTNSANGTVVQYEGATLTKDTDTIDAAGATPGDGSAEASTVAEEQFGLAIDTTANGGAITGGVDTAFGTTGQLDLITAYASGNGTITDAGAAQFAFVPDTPTTVATSATNDQYVGCDTAVVRYLANISPLTPAGTYTTTIVYSAVPTY